MNKTSSVALHLDALPTRKKVSGVAAVVEITAYPNKHSDIAGHPLNGRAELHQAIDYLYDRLEREASA